MVLLEFSIYPVDKGASLSPYVARAVEIVAQSGLPYQVHAMGTVVEGEMEPLLQLVARCFEALRTDCDRIECVMKLDYRRGRSGAIAGKVASIERQLGQSLPKNP